MAKSGTRQAGSAFGSFFLKWGTVVIVAAIAIWLIHREGLPGSSWIASWYDQPQNIPGLGTIKGDDYAVWGGTLGFICLFVGGLATVAAKIGSAKPAARAKAQ